MGAVNGSTRPKRARDPRTRSTRSHGDRDRARHHRRRRHLRGGGRAIASSASTRARRTFTPGPASIPSWRCARRTSSTAAPARGPLHGVPIGVKDIIDTADLPTEMGSPIYRGHRPTADAACVALVRAAGAVILGKTVTCEFAGMTPGATTNPHNSPIRPAARRADRAPRSPISWCRWRSARRPAARCCAPPPIAACSASSRPSAPSTAAASIRRPKASTRSGCSRVRIDDIELLSDVLELRPPSAPAALDRPPRIGLCRTPLWNKAQPETVAALEDAAARLGKAGAQVREIALPEEFSGLRNAARETINNYERAAAMAYEWNTPPRGNQRAAAQAHRDRARHAARRLSRGLAARRRLPRAACRPCSRTSTCCWRHVPTARRRAASAIPAIPASRRSGPFCTHRRSPCRPIAARTDCRSASSSLRARYADRKLFACARWVWQALGAPEMIGTRG